MSTPPMCTTGRKRTSDLSRSPRTSLTCSELPASSRRAAATAPYSAILTTSGAVPPPACPADSGGVGAAVPAIGAPGPPCFQLGIKMGDEQFPGRFEAAGRPGAYLRVITPGPIAAGDGV